MLLKSAFLFQLLTFKFNSLVSAQNPDVGRIFIGSPDPATGLPVTPVNNEYSFSSSSLLGQTLPVYALVFSGSNPAQIVPKTENITVNCVVPAASPGFTGVQISPVNLMATENSTQVPLLLTTSGRSVEVSCFGQSQSAACPVTADGAQFCPGTSQSNSVFITVRPPGTVSICETEIILKDNGPGSNCGFSVCLSEPASGSSVNVTCTSSGSLTMTIQSLVINVGGSGGQVVCSVPNPVAGSEANVTCRASSQTGSQFISSNTVETSTARFVLRANTVNFQPAWSQIYNTSFSSFFYLTGAVESGIVSVSCQAVVVGSVAEAESAVRSPDCSFTSGLTSTASTATTVTVAATTVTSTVTTTITTTLTNVTSANGTSDNTTLGTTTPVTMSTARPTTPPDPTSRWRVVNSDFDISSSPLPLIFQPVTSERLREVIDVRTEVIVTTCCVLNTSSNLNYRGQSAVAVAVADLAPYVCSKCDSAAITNPGNERVLQNPGFVEVSPCSCDLTQNGCDINCCCDSDCSQNQRARFSACIPGLPGGQSAEPQDYKCSSNALNQPDWQLLTCVYWENNGYLGMFYMNRRKLQSIDQINAEVYRTYRGKFSLSETERRFTEEDSILPDYQYGTIVQTCRKDVAANVPTSTGTLALSQPGPGATCNPLSPVRYLIDQSSHCRTVVTRDACSPLSVLSARVYAVSSTVSGCSQFYKILKTFKGNETALADVRYYCATDLTLVLPPATPSLENLGPTASSSFPANLANVNCSDGCSDPACWQYNTNQSTEGVPPLPPQCTWDDGFTSSPVPSLEGDTCFNVVVDVRYNFEWRGSEITKLSAIIILANIPNVGGRDVEIVQKFSVNWLNKPNTTVPVSDNYTQTSNPYERSGTAGYDIGKPLASGCAQYNTSTGQFDQVDVISQKQMAIWRPGVDGLCANARRQQITFGEDALSGCALRLTFADLNDSCDELRKLITNHLNVLMAGDVIGRYGYNNAQDESMWIPVLRQQLNITTPDSGSSVPANTSTVGNSTSLNVTSQELFTWASAITGICLLPSAVNLHILYAQTGAVNGYPRLEVVGAYINYTVSNFTMDCMGVNKRRCDPGSGYTQNFILSSSVTFVKVPPTLPVAHSRFYTRCDPDNFVTDSCYRYFMDFATEECYYDTCWQELAYPVLPGFLGDSQPYSLSFFLVLVLGVVGYVSVARPGWS